ncbi:hypothetical protein L2E82_20318 [Cichorium intybus]|uniref:Uncharacterized protein n=1 Tax=Cichorium intybus TaxID=13427 RepID=A0ACB9DT13_CICIN|nr:hypothetical protein L2E82_20318 [Cichorium intybus]
MPMSQTSQTLAQSQEHVSPPFQTPNIGSVVFIQNLETLLSHHTVNQRISESLHLNCTSFFIRTIKTTGKMYTNEDNSLVSMLQMLRNS